MGWEHLLAWVSGKVDEQLRLKVDYLVAEDRILRDQISGRPRLTDGQRITLATIGKKLGQEALEAIACIVTPETILRWHRELVARKFDTSECRKSKCVGAVAAGAAVLVAGAIGGTSANAAQQTVQTATGHAMVFPTKVLVPTKALD